MCVICVSNKGIRQPNREEITNCFVNNPDGAGFMYVKNGKVEIHKAFNNLDDYLREIESHNFTKEDVVIYHFRISTQARNLNMTHPFPLTNKLELTEKWDLKCDLGICHNGIIYLTTDKSNQKYSDTALYITNYLSKYITNENVIFTDKFKNNVLRETNSKWAFLTKDGKVSTIGDFIEEDGLLFSNSSYLSRSWNQFFKPKTYTKPKNTSGIKSVYVKVLNLGFNKWFYVEPNYLNCSINDKVEWNEYLNLNEPIQPQIEEFLAEQELLLPLVFEIQIVYKDLNMKNIKFKYEPVEDYTL